MNSPSTVPVKIRGQYAVLPLGKGRYGKIDLADWHLVSETRWAPHKDHNRERWYVRGRYDGKFCHLHRLIQKTEPGALVDHENGDGTDNRRSNLRPSTRAENRANMHTIKGTSHFRGVFYNRNRSKWQVLFKKNRKAHYGGLFTNEIEAAKVADAIGRRLYGEFYKPNFSARSVA